VSLLEKVHAQKMPFAELLGIVFLELYFYATDVFKAGLTF